MFPFANTLAVADVNGDQLKRLFEAAVEYYNDSSVRNLGEFLHVSTGTMTHLKDLVCFEIITRLRWFSGIRVEYDLKKRPGERVVRLLVRDSSSMSGNMAPAKANVTYHIGMPSFIARGGSRFAFMNGVSSEDTSNTFLW